METFTAVIKSHINVDKSRTVKIAAEDTWIAHKIACSYYNELKEFIPTIKDSRNVS